MKRKALWILLLPWLVLPALAQTDNTVYVKSFMKPGYTVGMAATLAQATCTPGLTCIVIFDPSLALYPTGTMPTQCALCLWQDYRTPSGGSGSVGAHGTIQAAGSNSGSFAAATPFNIGAGAVDSNNNQFLSNVVPSGWPFPSGTITNYIVGGSGTGASLGGWGNGYQTTATFSSGATSITVASTGTCTASSPISCIGQLNNVSGAGIPAGCTVNSSYGNNTGSVTVPLNCTTTAPGPATVWFTPGNTTGSIFWGQNVAPLAVASNGSILVGNQSGAELISSGLGGEDMNETFVGTDSFDGESGYAYFDVFNTQYRAGAENVGMGLKVYEHGHGENTSIMMGAHNYLPAMGDDNLWLTPGINPAWGSTDQTLGGSFVAGYYSIFLGANMFPLGPPATGTIYQAPHDIYISPSGMACWFNTGPDTIIGANFGQKTGSCTTLVTVTNSVYIESGANNTGQFASSWTAGSADVVVTAEAGTKFGGGLTTGTNDSIFGAGAGAAIASASQASLFGYDAMPQASAGNASAYGAFSLYSYTDTHSTDYLAAYGAYSCYSEVSGTYVTCSGAYAGYSDTASNVAYDGANSGNRSSATAGHIAVYGPNDFSDTTGATGTEAYDAFFGGGSDCLGCTYSFSGGFGANLGAVSHSVQFDAGTNNTSNTFQWQNLTIATLTSFSVSGCGTVTSLTGNGYRGTFVVGATSCTPVLTTGVTATNGFHCEIHDRNSPSVVGYDVSSTTTAVTFNALTVASGDVMSFSCGAY